MGKLSDKTREILQEMVFDYLMDEVSSSTTKHLVVNGVKALCEYTDEDLVEEVEYRLLDDEDDEMRTLIKKAKAELE